MVRAQHDCNLVEVLDSPEAFLSKRHQHSYRDHYALICQNRELDLSEWLACRKNDNQDKSKPPVAKNNHEEWRVFVPETQVLYCVLEFTNKARFSEPF